VDTVLIFDVTPLWIIQPVLILYSKYQDLNLFVFVSSNDI